MVIICVPYSVVAMQQLLLLQGTRRPLARGGPTLTLTFLLLVSRHSRGPWTICICTLRSGLTIFDNSSLSTSSTVRVCFRERTCLLPWDTLVNSGAEIWRGTWQEERNSSTTVALGIAREHGYQEGKPVRRTAEPPGLADIATASQVLCRVVPAQLQGRD